MMDSSKVWWFRFFVILFHIIGFFGLVLPVTTGLWIKLVPFHLMTMFAVLLLCQPHKNRSFWVFILITYVLGFGIELAGVHTGEIFGVYVYESTLGIKLAEVPLLIGINWILILFTAGCLVDTLGIKQRIIRSLLGAGIVVFLDFLIEPIAVLHHYWSWPNLHIPIQNYIAWFVFSFFMLMLFTMLNFNKRNPVASVLFVSQFLFFLALNLTIR